MMISGSSKLWLATMFAITTSMKTTAWTPSIMSPFKTNTILDKPTYVLASSSSSETEASIICPLLPSPTDIDSTAEFAMG